MGACLNALSVLDLCSKKSNLVCCTTIVGDIVINSLPDLSKPHDKAHQLQQLLDLHGKLQ